MFNEIIYRDTASAFEDWLKILRRLGCGSYWNSCTLADAVWEVARTHEEIPHFGNIAQELVLTAIERWLFDERSDWVMAYEVNARASWLSINGININDYRQFVAMFEQAAAEAV